LAVLDANRKRERPRAELKAQETADSSASLPTAKEIMEQIALKEAEKASAAARELSAAEAEKKALIENFSRPSGVSDESAWRAQQQSLNAL
jgi:hypothetical protein